MQEIQTIIERILQGDRSSERELYDLFRKRWYMLAMRYSRNRDEANDVMQEGLIEIFRDLHLFDNSKAKFTTWSSKVMVHAILRYLKNNQWNNHFLDVDKTDISDETEENIFDRLSAKELIQMVQQLPLGYRLVFNMYVIEGYKHKEIAHELGITVGTSKSQLSKAKRMLKNRLETQIKSYSNG